MLILTQMVCFFEKLISLEKCNLSWATIISTVFLPFFPPVVNNRSEKELTVPRIFSSLLVVRNIWWKKRKIHVYILVPFLLYSAALPLYFTAFCYLIFIVDCYFPQRRYFVELSEFWTSNDYFFKNHQILILFFFHF